MHRPGHAMNALLHAPGRCAVAPGNAQRPAGTVLLSASIGARSRSSIRHLAAHPATRPLDRHTDHRSWSARCSENALLGWPHPLREQADEDDRSSDAGSGIERSSGSACCTTCRGCARHHRIGTRGGGVLGLRRALRTYVLQTAGWSVACLIVGCHRPACRECRRIKRSRRITPLPPRGNERTS